MNKLVLGGSMVLAAAIFVGCDEQTASSDVSAKLAELSAQQAALIGRVTTLETENQLLKAQIEKPEVTTAVVAQAETNQPAAPMITPEVAQALAKTINDMVLSDLDRVIDSRIASQVGTAQDIEGYFVEAFDQQMDVRQQREREEREQQRRESRERRDRGQVEQMAEVVGMDENQTEQIYAAYTNMRSRIHQSMEDMRESGQFDQEAFQQARNELEEGYQEELQKVMSADQYATYQNDWRGTNRMERFSGFFGGRGGRR